MRTPEGRRGDFSAQMMANLTGIARLQEIMQRNGQQTTIAYGAHFIDYAEQLMRSAIAAIPDGSYHFEDALDDDGFCNTRLPVRADITIGGSNATIDFTRSADQTDGCVNAVRSITVSAVLYLFRCLIDEDIPANAGCLRPLTIVTRPGTIVDARFPAAVAGGNVGTSQRIVDVLLGALHQAIPGRIPATGQGTMNNITLGGIDPRSGCPFAYYETIAGGMGALNGRNGQHGVHSHMTNTLNTPVEALEYAYPLRVTAYRLQTGSGGGGRFPGGMGIVRELELLADAELTVLSERRVSRPYGLAGGKPGEPGKNFITRDGHRTAMPGKFQAHLKAGNRITVITPGGYGSSDRE